MRSYEKAGVVDRIRAAGGEVYAITSEPQRLASQAREVWELPFESIGDPHHEISGTCRERGLLELFVNTSTDLIEQGASNFRHPKGYFQPGVLALDSGGRVLYRWRSRPSRKNIGGAIGRPTPEHVFEQVSSAIAEATTSGEHVDAGLDQNAKLDAPAVPWPIFVALLVANGWFLEPRVFSFRADGLSAGQRIRRAARRLALFAGAWIAALVLLPTLWVGLAFAAWAIYLTPKVRVIQREFQNIPE